MRIILALTGLLFFSIVHGQKKNRAEDVTQIAVYEGGHKFHIELRLFSDSSFRYLLVPDIGFFKKKSRGYFERADSSLTLHTRRNFAALRFGKHKYWTESFRLKGKELLMYSKEQEQSADANFYKAYYTLTLQKN